MVEVVVKRNGSRAMVYVLDEKANVYGGRPVKDVLSFDCEDWDAIQEAVNGYLRKRSEKKRLET